MGNIVNRSEVNDVNKWSVNDLIADDNLWQSKYSDIEKRLQEFDCYKNNINLDNITELLELRDEISLVVEQLYVYANLRANEDTANTFYQELSGKADRLATLYSQATAFIEPEILSLKNKLNEELNEESIPKYSHYLNEVFRSSKHILSAEKEGILAAVSETLSAPSNIFYMLNNADMVFPDAIDKDNKRHTLTHGTYVSNIESSDRELRKSAFNNMYDTYYKHKNTLTSIYYSSVKNDVFSAKIRNYTSSLNAALFNYNIPEEVYHNLIATVNNNLHLMHKYVKIRKNILKLDDLNMYDIYTPIVSNTTTKISYEEAKETILKALAPLGDEYISILTKALNEEKWVDIYENQGKRSGAYSWGAYGCHPYVSMNYKDNLDSMFTLAHEMGHAMHSYYTWETQPKIYGDYTIFVAEVASTVNEALLMEYLLKNTNDINERKYLLNHFMDQFRGTLFRQTMFAEFELKTHKMVEQGEALTFDNICQLYIGLNQKYYGNDIISNDKIAWEWARIPHFYTAFYVYQYATGYSAAITLSKKILENNGAKDYINFLKGGSSKYSIDLLKDAGVDMTKGDAINNAMAVFEQIINEMEELTANN